MLANYEGRDYSLTGPESKAAVEHGLAAAEWYHTDIARQQMKQLMRRSDWPAIPDTMIWLGVLIGSAAGIVGTWGSLWMVPLLLVYGVMYGSATDSRWHECGHGTAFKTRWMNTVVYHLACFMIMREPTVWRWSHARHHTDTLIVGRDPEIAAMRPPKLIKIIANFFGLVDVPLAFFSMLLHAAGRLTLDERDYIPEVEQHKVIVVARFWVAIYVAVIASCFWFNSIIPLVLVPGGRLYGAWHFMMCGLTQHAGMAEDVFDHRLNSRTVYMNPISRFIYWNMNFHVEHHMFPMVPYHRLPELHAVTKHDCPTPYSGFLEAYREIVPTVIAQLRDQRVFVRRQLPDTARPFRPDLHDIPGAAPAE